MDSWLLQQQGQESFVSLEDLRRLARAGRLAPSDLVFHPQQSRWLYLRDVEELRGDLATAAPMGGAPSRALVPRAAAAPGLVPTAGAALAPSDRSNDSAIAGFTLGVLSVIPVLGVACALVGLPLSVRGMRRGEQPGVGDRKVAIAGMVLALTSLVIHGGLTLLALLG